MTKDASKAKQISGDIRYKSIKNHLNIRKLYLVDPWKEYNDYMVGRSIYDQKDKMKIKNVWQQNLYVMRGV